MGGVFLLSERRSYDLDAPAPPPDEKLIGGRVYRLVATMHSGKRGASLVAVYDEVPTKPSPSG